MATPLFTYFQKSPQQIHDDLIRSWKSGFQLIAGIPNPNVAPKSDYDILAWGIAYEVATGQANATILADQLMPDTAAGSFLDRWLNLVGLARRAAVGSHGNITITLSATSTIIAAGAQLIDNSGLRFQVSVGGTYANGALVPVTAVDVGSATNHNNGDVLRWVSAPAFSNPTATVGTVGGTDGLSNGADSEVGTDEPPRNRLLAWLANPPKGGNWQQVALWAAQSSSLVQFAAVYPALNGPATTYVSVSGAVQTVAPFTSASKSRAISSTIVSTTIAPYVQGLLPENTNLVCLSSVDSPTDVAIQLSLPTAPTASPPGPGGGWLDGTPWPQTNSGTPVSVTSLGGSPQNFTVNAQTAPTAGLSHIAWLSPFDWTIHTAIVLNFSGSAGAYNLTIDTPFTNLALGNYIWPQAQNQQNYVNALLGAFAAMGPGEWTSSSLLLSGPLGRSFRHPLPTLAAPYSLGATQLKQVILSGSEVLDASYLFRSQTTPAVPATNTVGPNIFTPRNLSFYQQ